MNKYKIHGEGVILTATNSTIPNDQKNDHWKLYNQWLLEGNTPDPEFSIDELREKALLAIEVKVNKLTDESTDTDPRVKRRTLARAIKLLRKELKNTATAEELNELDIHESIANYIDEIENTATSNITWVNDQNRTIAELESFDPNIDITWPPKPV